MKLIHFVQKLWFRFNQFEKRKLSVMAKVRLCKFVCIFLLMLLFVRPERSKRFEDIISDVMQQHYLQINIIGYLVCILMVQACGKLSILLSIDRNCDLVSLLLEFVVVCIVWVFL